jgi:Uma2 family endonuclease
MLVEVLSPSTESYDRSKKSQYYRTVESLQEYLLITQDSYHVEHYVHQPDGSWRLTDVNGVESVVQLTSIGCALSLADVYEKVTLEQGG